MYLTKLLEQITPFTLSSKTIPNKMNEGKVILIISAGIRSVEFEVELARSDWR